MLSENLGVSIVGGEDPVIDMVALSSMDKITEEPLAKPARWGRFLFSLYKKIGGTYRRKYNFSIRVRLSEKKILTDFFGGQNDQ